MVALSVKRARNSESGQAVVMLTIGTVFIFGLLGVAIDVGYGYYLKQVAQAAADSSVMAGAAFAQSDGSTCTSTVRCQTDYTCPASPTNPPASNFDAACLYAAANGFSAASGRSVKISGGTGVPPSNSGVSVSYWMSAKATQTLPITFTRVMGYSNGSVSAQATSGLIAGNAGGCMWILDPTTTASSSFNETGTGNIQSNCSIYVNSGAAVALSVSGKGTLKAASINVVGGVTLSNNSTVSPAPITGVSPRSDPLASLPAPTYSGCDHTNLQINNSMGLSPGVYCGGIKITSGANVTFAPGNYILNGGGLAVTSSNATLNGSGVMFYNTSNGYTFGPFTITGGATINLSAPTSGTYRGILMYQDRTITGSANNGIGGGASETYSGTVYLPTAYLDFTGGSSSNILTLALIVKDLNLNGNAYLAKDTSGSVTGIPQSTIGMLQ